MPLLKDPLVLDCCPHCGVDTPSLPLVQAIHTTSKIDDTKRFWYFYACSRCGGVVTAAAWTQGEGISELYPSPLVIDEAIPEPAREYLRQASRSLSNPAGCVMLCASAVDALLKAKSYKDGSLYTRIEKAAQDHLITSEMAQWAHEVRLDANEPRHADEESPLPTDAEARKCLDFAMALAQFLIVLPSRVKRGLEAARRKSTQATD